MKAKLDCIPCVLRQVLRASRYSDLPEYIQEDILRKSMKALLKEDWNKTPPEIADIAHKIARRYAEGDPYEKVKKKSNDEALVLYPELKKIVEESTEPLRTAIRIAIAGNIIDFGALEESEINIEKTVKDVLSKKFAYDDYLIFKDRLKKAKNILYFVDNAGEIVFDRLLIETIKGLGDFKITLSAKAGPIINDATIEDVKYVDLDGLVDEIRCISNGEVGSEINSLEVKKWIEEHDIIISKGQGNYEGLSEFSGIFYMLIVKCPIIGEDIGANVGDIVLLYK